MDSGIFFDRTMKSTIKSLVGQIVEESELDKEEGNEEEAEVDVMNDAFEYGVTNTLQVLHYLF